MHGHRFPLECAPNAWSALLAERRARGAPLVDLTESNPTRAGLSPAPPPLNVGAVYEPAPRGIRAAREAIAAYWGGVPGVDDIVVTSGTSEAYAHLMRLLARPGDAFLVPRPSYPLLEPLARIEGLDVRTYRLAYDGEWHLDRESFESGISSGARAAVVVQPNHRTGTCLAADDLAFVDELCARHGVALVSDEVFADFRWNGTPPVPTLARPPRAPLSFVLSGLSKVCGLPQLKLSWIAVAGPEAEKQRALEGLDWIADLFLSVSGPVQEALPDLLAARSEFQSRVRERVERNLAEIALAERRQPALRMLRAQGGWVAVLRVPAVRSDEEWALELLRRDVAVHPGHFYDFDGDGHLVLSLIVHPDEFRRGLARIEELASAV
jgi:aspartate/methionine/tyrosine aminotransferase